MSTMKYSDMRQACHELAAANERILTAVLVDQSRQSAGSARPAAPAVVDTDAPRKLAVARHPLLDAAEAANLIGAELRVIRVIADAGGRIRIADADTLCGCNAIDAFKRAKRKLKGWKFKQVDNQLCIDPV